MIESKCELLPIGEVKALLLEHEARIKKFQKRLADSPSIIVAQGYTHLQILTIISTNPSIP